ncbi:hypothetical protein BH10ACT3_BH10ACT3_10180 [soil metagenome]
MTSSAPSTSTPRTSRPLRAVPEPPAAAEQQNAGPLPPRTSATEFAECVRTIVTLARRRGLRPPAFRSPPRLDGVDRSIQRRRNGATMVAVRRGDRPFAAIQGDIIEGVVVANQLGGQQADRFRHAAWTALQGVDQGAAPRPSAGPQPPAPLAPVRTTATRKVA